MASSTTVTVDKDASCANDPDFAVICAFLEKFSDKLNVKYPDFKQLQEWLSNTDEVPKGLRDLHIKLMRITRRTVHECAWESALSKFCFCYSSQDGWEIERFGYKKSSLKVKLRILRQLLENQFDRNNKFRAKLLTMSADSLRSQPIGRDRLGHSYWLTQDPECNIRIYQEHLDEEIWQVVATNREELVKLILRLKGNEVVLPSDIGFIDEDSSSNSCSAPIEKPPPPEEKDDSQESNQSTSGRVPNIKIKLGNKDNGNIATVSNEPEEPPPSVSNGEMEEEKKVKPLVISQSKIKMEISKKRSLDEGDKIETHEVKKQRPTLLDLNREKKLGRYEKQEEEEEDDDDDEEEEDENDGGEDEEDAEDDVDDEGEEEEDDENSSDEGEEEDDIDEMGVEEEHDEEDDEDDDVEKKEEKKDKEKEHKLENKIENNSETIKTCQNISEMIVDKNDLQDINGKETKVEKDMKTSAEQEKVPQKEEEILKMENIEKTDELITPPMKGEEVSAEKDSIEDVDKPEKEEEQNENKSGSEGEKEVEGASTEIKIKIRNEDEEKKEEVEKVVEDEEVNKATSAAIVEGTGDKSESDKVESSSEDVEMEELKFSSEENNPSDEPEVGEAIDDPAVIVKGEGSGTECEDGFESFFSSNQLSDVDSPEFSEEIEDMVMFVHGEGSGAESLVGNAKTSETEGKATFFFGQPGCLKLSPVKNQSKSDDSENDCNDNTEKPEEEEVKKVPEPTNGENHSESESVKKTLKVSSLDKKRTKPESKNGNSEERRPTRRTLINRKRRLSDEKPEKPAPRPSSESETDLNSENLEDQILEEEEEEDVGGKRLKMRSKLVNTEIRKKVEAQRKTVTKEETTTSSSGGEEELPRKKLIVKKIEKEPEKTLTPKAKLKQKARVSPAPSKSIQIDDKEVKSEEKVDEKPTEKSSDEKVSDKLIEEEVIKTSTSTRSSNKQTKKPHPVESNDECDEEIPKKKQPQEQVVASQCSTELVKIQKGKSPALEVDKSETLEVKKAKILETSVEGEQSTSDKQRKRRSSENDSKETTPDSVVVVKTTRSSRRSGLPEPAIELPQVKRTRVKASVKAEVKAEPKTEVKSEAKSQISNADESEKNTPEAPVKEQEPKKEEVKKEEVKMGEVKKDQVKKEEVKNEQVVQVKEELKVKEEPVVKPTIILTSRPRQQAAQKQPATSTGQRRKCHDDVDTKNIIDLESDGTPVRMSRRIAQLKIREEADRRKMEEIALRNMKAELKKKKKAECKPEDPTVSEPSEHSSDQAESEVEVKKKAEKKKKLPGKDGWSSGSEEPDEEEIEEHPYEIDHGSPLFKSDHEFSPESDLEDESQVVPLKRARTAKKEGDEDELETHSPDESCQKCGKSDHPEWILLCDKCNKGYHCSCLSPVIFYIPEGDWFCPPCQQEVLIIALENHLKEFDDLVQRKKEEEEEKVRIEEEQRLELEKAALVKVEKQIDQKKGRKQKSSTKKGSAGGGGSSKNRRKTSDDDDRSDGQENGTETEGSSNSSNSSSSGSGSSKSKSSSGTDTDDEPIYKLRKRRQINVSYRLNEYDEMIKSALKKEEDAVAGAGNLGRGKDISNIYEGVEDKPLTEDTKVEENGGVENPSRQKAAAAEDSGSDFEPIKRKPKTGRNVKKKHRKLTKLDISSEGDNDSDEDFKTSSMDDDEEEDDDDEEVSQSSDSSLDVYRRRRGSRKGKKKKSRRAARRSARERRKDRKFIVDDSDCDGSEGEVRPRTKKKRKKDSDYTETETNDDDDELSENIDSEDLCDDSTDSEASDGAWCPSKRKKQRSNAIARKSPKLKPKMGSKPKKTKRYDSDSDSFKAVKSKNRMIRDDSEDDDSDDSVDSSRKTRGKRCTYLDYDDDDDSSDGGIKPGVKRPDTPPEEREKFIKKQEEIKRMLAEKNAEGAKLAATPRLIPIKTGAHRSPAKLDSLSTVPLAVIRQAKVLDIDYLQRKGESISEGDLDESEFDDDDLPDDFNPEDMDEEAIARMVEEDFAQQQQLKLPLPSEVLRKKSAKESEPVVRPVSTYIPAHAAQQQQSSSSSGLQEPVRKKLPMPTIHPPLLRHGYGPPMMLQSRQPHLPLLQNALSAPLNQSMSRQFPPSSQAIPATHQVSQQQGATAGSSGGSGDPNKPRGRRKKITPLRDPLQKQQAAAAASAAAAAASKPRPDNTPPEKSEVRQQPPPPPPIVQSATPGVIKSALSIAQPPQLYKPPAANTQPSVITRMPHLQARPMMHMGGGPGSGPPFPEQGPRFYRPQHPQSHLRPQAQQQHQQHQRLPPPQQSQSQQQQHRQPPPPSQSQSPSQPNSLIPGNRPPMRHRGPPMPPMSSHHSMRPSFVGGPPPLRPSSGGGPPPPISLANNIVRDQGPPRQSSPYSGPDQYSGPPPPSRHSAPPPPPHLSPYRPQMYNNPGFPHRGPPVNSSQPSLIRPVGAPPPEYSSPPGSFGGGYGYYPPPLSVPHSAPPPPTASAVPSSVIVSASSLGATTSVVVAPPSQPVPAIQPPSRPPASSPSLIEKPAATAPLPPTSTTIPTSVIELSRKKLTTLETFNTSKNSTPPPLRESSESRSPYSSNPPTIGGPDDAPDDGSGSPPTSSQSTSEFSGLVSYFSSQHDDLNT